MSDLLALPDDPSLRLFASNLDEEELLDLYLDGNTEQRIAQMLSLTRHRVRAILLAVQERVVAQRRPFRPWDSVYWQGLGGTYRGEVIEPLSLAERSALSVRADLQDEDWYWVATPRQPVAKMGKLLKVLL